jgi:hypothetical protein
MPVPDTLEVHAIPSEELRMVPPSPTANNWVPAHITLLRVLSSDKTVCQVHFDWAKAPRKRATTHIAMCCKIRIFLPFTTIVFRYWPIRLM